MSRNKSRNSGSPGRHSNNDFLSLWDFFQLFVKLNRLELPLKALHQDACDLIQRALLGQLEAQGIEFIVINIPPRVGKTKIMEALLCWFYAYFPDAQNIYTSYAGDLATASTRYIQDTMNSPWYRELFPHTRLGSVQQADHFVTTAGGQMHAEGVGGGLTGKGAGLKRIAGGCVIIDDPAKPDEALSETKSEAVRFWFENTLKSRRNSSTHTPIIICAQRIADNDLSGFVLKNYPEQTVHIKHAALVDGESIIPETVSTASLLATQRVNPFAFMAQYQQEPIILGGNMIKTGDFFLFDSLDLQWEKKIITVDTALKDKQHNDCSVLQLWGLLDKKAYLLDMVYGRWQSPQLLVNAEAFWKKHHDVGGFFHAPSPVRKMTIEEAAAGIGLIQQLRQAGIPAMGIVRTKDKVTRVHEVLPYIVTHMVGVYKQLPNIQDFLRECAAFRPDGKHEHDDMVDAMVDGIWECLGRALSILDVVKSSTPAAKPANPTPIDACAKPAIENAAKPAPAEPALELLKDAKISLDTREVSTP